MQDPTHFVFLLIDGFPHISLSCAIEPLRLANFVAGRTLYRWSLGSIDGSPLSTKDFCNWTADNEC